jgi:hypothetical protein
MGLMDKFKDGMQQAQQAQQQTAGGGAPGMPTQQDMEYMNRVTKLNNSGVEHPATIKSMQSTGKTDMGGGAEYQIEVEVQPAGGSPYNAQFSQFMHEGSMGSWATEGAAVKVRVDPDDPSSMILWGGQQ